MRHRFVLGLLGLGGMLWAACRDAAAPGRLEPGVNRATAVHAEFTFSCVQLACQFTDQSTTDSGTPPVSNWLWRFGDDASSTDQHPAHTYVAPGTYAVTLQAFRSLGESDSVTHIVTVSADSANMPPHAEFSFNCSGLTCQFTDSSFDADGMIVRFEWEFGDGGRDTVPNPTHTYAAAGSYDVFHAVVDDDGAVDSLRRTVTVTADTGGGNQPPIAIFDFNCTGLTCQFTDQSVDSGGTIVQWTWFFGDGTSDTLQNPAHTYDSASTYQVTLVVFDNDGATDTTSRSVAVADTGGGGGSLTLVAEGFRVKGLHSARLLWSGATADSFLVFRDSAIIAGFSGDTTYVDNIGAKGHAAYIYQVCQVGGDNRCSNTAAVQFSRPSSTRRR